MKKVLISLFVLAIAAVFCQYVFAEGTVLKLFVTRIQAKLTPLNQESTCNSECTPSKLITVEGKLLPDPKHLELIKDNNGVGEIVEIKN